MNSISAVALLACVAVATATSVLHTPLTYTGHPSYVVPRVVSHDYVSSELVKPVDVIKPVDEKAAVVPSTYTYGVDLKTGVIPSTYTYGVDLKTGVIPSTYTYGGPVVYNSGYYPYSSLPISSYPYNYPVYGYNYKI